jgi:hypothetical protein
MSDGWSTGAVVLLLIGSGLVLILSIHLATSSEQAVETRLSLLPRIYLGTLFLLLTGYMLFGKGFAYIHLPLSFPLYVGEILLLFGLFALAFHNLSRCWNTVTVLYALFAALGTAGMLRHILRYGVEAVRDSALWYYGLFMILVLAFISERKHVEAAFRLYAIVVPFAVLSGALFAVARGVLGIQFPYLPGTTVSIISVKGGEIAVHCSALLALLCFSRKGEVGAYLLSKPLALGCFCAFLVTSFAGRGPLLSIASGAILALLIAMRGRHIAVLLAVALLVTVFFALDVRIKRTDQKRDISAGSLRASVESIFGTVGDPRYRSAFEGTKRWRLQWWEEIVHRAATDPELFWFGRGFGPNMAQEMGYESGKKDERPLRSPHCSHLNILYRMGFPGAVLWLTMNTVFVILLLRGIRRARGRDPLLFSGLAVTLCFWVAAQVNGSFDVYLEGPMGGIWFWTVQGLALALVRMTNNLEIEAKR